MRRKNQKNFTHAKACGFNHLKMKTKNSEFTGKWNIYEMETWDEEYLHEDGQAFIKLNKDKTGEFKFGYVNAEIDGRIVERGGEKSFEFTFDGNDESESCQGRGCIKLSENNPKILEGELFFHMGDSSTFSAKKVKEKKD